MSTNAAPTWPSVERKAAISLFKLLADFGFELFVVDKSALQLQIGISRFTRAGSKPDAQIATSTFVPLIAGHVQVTAAGANGG